MDNRGAKRLRELGLTQTRIGEMIGVDSGVVSRWFRAKRKPDTVQRARLEDEYGIGWRLWDEEIPGEPADPEEQSVFPPEQPSDGGRAA